MTIWLAFFFSLLGFAARASVDVSGIAFDQRLGALLPMSAPFTDETGRTVTLSQVGGGLPMVIAFGYARCPNLCGVVRDDALSALTRTGLAAGRDYHFVFVSIDPHERAADAARAKAEDMVRYPAAGADSGWRFLTGYAPSLDEAQRAAGFHDRYDSASIQFLHPAGLVFATSQGVISGYVMGVGYGPGDVRAAIGRAAAGEIGQAASPVLLLCFHFDPFTGRYTLAVTKLLRLGAVLTMFGIIFLVVLAQRRAGRRVLVP